jgi:two-component system chemotaxis response regulator CheB
VGHAWSGESLVAQQSSALETALWMALRGLEEKAALTRDMSDRARSKDQPLSAQAFDRQRLEAESASLLVRDLLVRVASGDVDLTPHART